MQSCYRWFGYGVAIHKIAKIPLHRHFSLFLSKSAHKLAVVHKLIVAIFRESGRRLDQRQGAQVRAVFGHELRKRGAGVPQPQG